MSTWRPLVADPPLGGTVWILNSFSLNLFAELPSAKLAVRHVELDEARRLAVGARSAVGHEDTAALFADLLDRPVPKNRTTLRLAPGDVALVGQHTGPRLPVGATSRPEGAPIQWIVVDVMDEGSG